MKNLISILCLLLTQNAAASPYTQSSTDQTFAASSAITNQQWLIGLESGGVLKHSTSRAEDNGRGIELGVKLVNTFQWLALDIDLAGGWRLNKLKEDQASVTTRTFFAEAGVRRPLSERWSVGPMVSALLGRDVSFSDFGTNSDKKMLSAFAGAKALYELPISEWRGRVGIQLQTDLNIGDRQITQLQVVAEFGWPTRQERPLEIEPPAKTFNLTRSGLNFNLDSAELSDYSKHMLNDLGRLLSAHPDQWQTVSVVGHSDSQGTRTYNLNLSEERATEVQRHLAGSGVPFARTVATGYGPDRPLEIGDAPEVHAKNRRVELVISGLREGSPLAEKIQNVLR